MSYTLKVILISLMGWLGVSLAIGAINVLSGSGFVETFMISGVVFGLFLGIALLITGIVIFIAKLDGKHRDQAADPEVLDGQPRHLTYQARGLAFLAAAGIIFLVGTSVCFGMFSI